MLDLPSVRCRLQWREMPTRKFRSPDDGIERFGLLHDFTDWKLRWRTADLARCAVAGREDRIQRFTTKFLSRTFFGESLTQTFLIN
jgi:hypothetical protein